ncbi:ssDNA exonuclease RecJ [Thiohalorhabdus denitrificans]|uniref:Single-stranded-DNA-specific exonuclease RecJ n=1 Tax=Thiohalorhabdus denitrificans TaxID=381306 RepID=A0A0N8PNI4_9GAMM|nr:single-stranded-DNA-specific exonuclease RecJ [Thiohalorhabdus denitrificans]KPV41613.1 ssDNA exonuclease RecJ [Thiohalorhabdus denitrificans]SCY57345.1 single-stranded-DNA-specific exonuclease [Thiohalorhabdus denitrificans]
MTGHRARQWKVRPRAPEAEQRLIEAGTDPLLARLYAARGIEDPGQLERRASALERPDSLLGMEGAVAVLAGAIERGETVCIVGDFDCDGATSTALSVAALRAMGARATYVIPDRFRFGYGLTPGIVAEAAELLAPDVLVTVDNGISSRDGVAAAHQRGMRVVVTDHHLPPAALPPADAIVNPNQPGCPFPAKSSAGVGVVFYVMAALRARLREDAWFAARGLEEPNLNEVLDLVAVGTVADVVPLERNNRILVHQGLERIRAGKARPGIRALIEVAGREPGHLRATDLGFVVGPRLNAAGRLEDMSLGIRCLLAEDYREARELAAELDALNQQRRSLEADMHDDAVEALADDPALAERHGVCLFREDWHQGVVGLVASRIKERLHRPVIAFAPGDGGLLKGSGRSVAGVHIRDVLERVATTHEGLLSRFGGHAMAAGLSLDPVHLDAFGDAFDRAVRELADPEALTPRLETDGELGPEELNLRKAELLESGGPWGTGFPAPLFQGRFRVGEVRVVGHNHLKMWLFPEGGDYTVEAIHFRGAPEGRAPELEEVELAYRLEVNTFRGRRNVQLVVEECRPAGSGL